MPDIVFKLLLNAIWSGCALGKESEQTPFFSTVHWSRSAALRRARSGVSTHDSLRLLWPVTLYPFLEVTNWSVHPSYHLRVTLYKYGILSKLLKPETALSDLPTWRSFSSLRGLPTTSLNHLIKTNCVQSPLSFSSSLVFSSFWCLNLYHALVHISTTVWLSGKPSERIWRSNVSFLEIL